MSIVTDSSRNRNRDGVTEEASTVFLRERDAYHPLRGA